MFQAQAICVVYAGYHSGYAAHLWVPVEPESGSYDVARVSSPVHAPYVPVIPLELADLSTPPPSFHFCMPDTTRSPPPLPWWVDCDQATGPSPASTIVALAPPLTRAEPQLTSGLVTQFASPSLEDSRSSGAATTGASRPHRVPPLGNLFPSFGDIVCL